MVLIAGEMFVGYNWSIVLKMKLMVGYVRGWVC